MPKKEIYECPKGPIVRKDLSLATAPDFIIMEIFDFIPNVHPVSDHKRSLFNGTCFWNGEIRTDYHDTRFCRRHDWRLLNTLWRVAYWGRVRNVIVRDSTDVLVNLMPMLTTLDEVSLLRGFHGENTIIPQSPLHVRRICAPVGLMPVSNSEQTQMRNLFGKDPSSISLLRGGVPGIHVTQFSSDVFPIEIRQGFVEDVILSVAGVPRFYFLFDDSQHSSEIVYDVGHDEDEEELLQIRILRIECIRGDENFAINKWLEWLEKAATEHNGRVGNTLYAWINPGRDRQRSQCLATKFDQHFKSRHWRVLCTDEIYDDMPNTNYLFDVIEK